MTEWYDDENELTWDPLDDEPQLPRNGFVRVSRRSVTREDGTLLPECRTHGPEHGDKAGTYCPAPIAERVGAITVRRTLPDPTDDEQVARPAWYFEGNPGRNRPHCYPSDSPLARRKTPRADGRYIREGCHEEFWAEPYGPDAEDPLLIVHAVCCDRRLRPRRTRSRTRRSTNKRKGKKTKRGRR